MKLCQLIAIAFFTFTVVFGKFSVPNSSSLSIKLPLHRFLLDDSSSQDSDSEESWDIKSIKKNMPNNLNIDRENIPFHGPFKKRIKPSKQESPPLFDWNYIYVSGFWASFSMIIVSELGDKTFFIAAILAMKHSRVLVLIGAMGALIVMTILAVIGGSFFRLIPLWITHYGAGVLFLVFGIKLLYEAYNMKGGEASEELREVEKELIENERKTKSKNTNKKIKPQILKNRKNISTLPSHDNKNDIEMNVTNNIDTNTTNYTTFPFFEHNDVELGENINTNTANITMIDNNNNNNNITSTTTNNNNNNNNNNDIDDEEEIIEKYKGNKRKWDWNILIRAFAMTFISEIGDRSQITTIVLAASKNLYGVCFGAIAGHGCCTTLAVVGGKLLASRISEKNVAWIGGLLFLAFSIECFIYGPA